MFLNFAIVKTLVTYSISCSYLTGRRSWAVDEWIKLDFKTTLYKILPAYYPWTVGFDYYPCVQCALKPAISLPSSTRWQCYYMRFNKISNEPSFWFVIGYRSVYCHGHRVHNHCCFLASMVRHTWAVSLTMYVPCTIELCTWSCRWCACVDHEIIYCSHTPQFRKQLNYLFGSNVDP